MINTNTNTINATIIERIETCRIAVEKGRSDMKFTNKCMKDWGVKLVRKNGKVLVIAA
jgi:hypothetical protein